MWSKSTSFREITLPCNKSLQATRSLGHVSDRYNKFPRVDSAGDAHKLPLGVCCVPGAYWLGLKHTLQAELSWSLYVPVGKWVTSAQNRTMISCHACATFVIRIDTSFLVPFARCKWFELRGKVIIRWSMIVRVSVVLRRTVCGDIDCMSFRQPESTPTHTIHA